MSDQIAEPGLTSAVSELHKIKFDELIAMEQYADVFYQKQYKKAENFELCTMWKNRRDGLRGEIDRRFDIAGKVRRFCEEKEIEYI